MFETFTTMSDIQWIIFSLSVSISICLFHEQGPAFCTCETFEGTHLDIMTKIKFENKLFGTYIKIRVLYNTIQ